MKAAALRELTPEELAQRGRESREEHFRLRVQQASSQLEKPLRLRVVRRDLARVATVQREREKR
ncbi:MAG: 50S ribosomal protein L29 [Candidatus Marinimicrobia bacterium]|nr:50S ribosomal protein L29 [Candidatus Neomarinimicrobiota bacterium]